MSGTRIPGSTVRQRLAAALLSCTLVAAVVSFEPFTAAPAAAAANIGIVEGRISNHTGLSGTSGNCIRYAPYTSGTATNWSATEVVSGHGVRSGDCSDIDNNNATEIKDNQSTVSLDAVSPAAAIGATPVLLGEMRHYNWPINVTDNRFTGTMSLRLSGMYLAGTTTVASVDFPFEWWETPNQSNGCTTGYQNDGCNDEIKFPSSVSQQIIVQSSDPSGTKFRLVVAGFVQTSAACAATLSPSASLQSSFITVEGQITKACLYISVQPIRQLTITKVVTAGSPTNTGFAFSSTSGALGSEWDNKGFTLTPSGTAARTAEILSQDTVTVSESALPSDKWSLDSVQCKVGSVVLTTANGITYDPATRKLTLVNVGEGNPINCTFTNKYTPKANLTLVKIVSGGTATVGAFTLTATGSGTAAGTTISGVSATAAVTGQRVPAGVYTLTETGVNGYVNAGWSCSNGVIVGATNQITLVDDANITCTVTNRFATGSLQIKKTVTGVTAGYSGGTTKTFSGTYNCGAGFTGSFSTLTTNTPVTVTGIPVGRTCTATESAPAGGLVNGSFSWGTATFAPASVPITDNTQSIITISNPVVQSTGRFTVAKLVAGPAGGYTGAASRTFPVGYSCSITNGPTLTGTLNPTTETVATSGQIPATSVCTFTETITPASGDFADTSYSWVGGTFSPTTLTIGVGTTVSTTVTNTYTRNFGAITVTKTAVGTGYIGTGEQFTITYDCGTGFSGSVVLAVGVSKTISGLPVGSICTFAETAPNENLLSAAYDWAAATWTGVVNNKVTVTAVTRNVGVTNPTVAVFGKVSVIKALSGDTSGATSGATFSIQVNCAAAYNQTLTFVVGTAQSTPDLPVGTSCTVTETAPTGGLVDSSYAWGTTPLAQTVTVTTKNTTVPVTVTNNIVRVRGPLTVAKAVVAPAGVVDPARTYAIDWSCSYGGAAPVAGTATLAAGASSVVSTQILLGSVCTVTEQSATLTAPPSATDASYVWQGAAYAPGQQVTIVTTTGASVTVTNSVRRLEGSFSIRKTVAGPSAGLPGNTSFSFTWSCSLPGGGTQTSASPVLLTDGQSTNAPTLPAGSVCTVTEGAYPATTDVSYSWDSLSFAVTGASGTPSGRSVTFTVPAPVGGTPVLVQVTATNTLSQKFGTINVSKVVSGQTGGFVTPGPDFSVTLACSTGTQTVLVKSGAAATSTSLPIGTTCTVSEVTPTTGLKDASYAWGTATINPTSVTINSTTVPVAVTVTNPIVRVLGSVQVSKTLAGPSGIVDPARLYTGSWDCSYGGASVGSGNWSTTAGAAPVVLSTTIPRTAICTVTEAALSVAPTTTDPSYRWLAPNLSGATVTATPASLLVANSFVRDTGSIMVTKSVTGSTAGYSGGSNKVFTVNYSCTTPGVTGALQGSVPVANGGTETLATGIPYGWSCVVTEASPSGNLVDASHAWGTPVITASPVVLSAATSTVNVEVDNPINRVRGSFQIVKAVTPIAGFTLAEVITATGNNVYSGTYSCKYGSDTAITGTWSSDFNGGTYPVPGTFLIGSVCTVSETAPVQSSLVNASWAWNAAVISAPATVAVSSIATVTVTNSVTRVWAGLDIIKVTTGATVGIKAGRTVSGIWQCSLGSASWNGAWSLPAGGGTADAFTVADQEVPAAATCVVTENTPDDADLADASYTWAAPTYSAPSVVLPVGSTASITVTNTVQRVYGDLSIRKSVTGAVASAGLINTNQTFSGSYSCTYGTDPAVTGTWSTKHGVATTIPSILVGSVCSVTETAPSSNPVPADGSYSWTSAVIGAPVTIKVPAQPAVQVMVENPTVRVLGGFGVAKAALAGTAAALEGAPAAAADYPFTYTCDVPGEVTPRTGSLMVEAAGATWSSPDDIPVGSVCTVQEPAATLPATADAAYTWGAVQFSVTNVGESGGTVNGDQVTFTIPSGSTPVVTATNTVNRAYGTWSVSKVASPASGTTVKPGDVITYTVSAIVTGGVPVHDIVVTDTLAEVTPYATVTTEPSTVDGIVTRTGNTITWSVGTAAAGTYTMTYKVTVKAAADGITMKNAVTAVGDTPPTTCTPGSPCTTEHYTPAWTLAKSSDPVSGSSVEPGDTITYTLTVANTSDATVSGAIVTDDVSAVLDNATLGGLPAGLTLSGNTLTWAVPTIVEGAAPVTVSYTVTVKAGVFGVTLKNVATPTGTAGSCVGACTTEHYTPAWTLAKSSDPVSGGTVEPGDTITYTLTVSNTSNATVAGAVVTDNVTAVLANATLGTLPSGLTLSGNTLTWAVPTIVNGGAPVTISYTATVTAGAFGVTLKNVATPTGGGKCVLSCTTEHYTPAWTLAKSSNPLSGSTVKPGDTITYTLTASNTSNATVTGAIVTDDLSVVLNNATLGDLPSGLTLSGNTLTWAVPTIAEGAAPVTVSYTVTVEAGAFGVTLKNVATPTGGGQCVLSCTTEHYTPAWTLAKSSDPVSGSTVEPGDTITYTLTATNTSSATVFGATVNDDVSDVLNNATLTTPLSAGLSIVGNTLTWNVPTMGTGTAARTVSYTVTIKAGANGVTMRNVATPNGGGGDCVVSCTTEHYTPKWTLAKSSNPVSGATVKPGDSVTYTLTVANTSDATVTGAIVIDDLSDVLDNATLSLPLPAGATLSGTTLTWAVPTLAAGAEPASLSYAVTVKVGVLNARLRNVAVPNGSGGECEVACTTEHYTPGWRLAKTSDPVSGSVVAIGQVITYTVTLTNTSAANVTGAVVVDDLSAVLDSATLTGTPSTTSGSASVSGTTLTWTPGTVPAAAVVTVTYAVTVNAGSFNRTLVNVIGGDGDTPPTTCPIDMPGVGPTADGIDPACSTTHNVIDRSADLAIVKTDNNPTPLAGSSFNWVLQITNNGPDTASSVVITDQVPDRVVVTAVNSAEFSCSAVGNAVTCTKSSMVTGEQGLVTITVSVPVGLGAQSIENVAKVTSSTPDPDLTNNEDAATVLTGVVVVQPPAPTIPDVVPSLPVTGTDFNRLVAIAFALLAAGWCLMLARRRRHDNLG